MNIDKLVDSAVARYAAAEPPIGLEERVLNRIRAEGAVPRFRFLRWALPVPALAGAALLVAFWMRQAPVSPVPGPPVRIVAQPLRLPGRDSSRPMRRDESRRGRQSVCATLLPKRDIFPTPTPLTAEERALIAFVASAPKEALEPAPETTIEPIKIEEIVIPPLQIGDGTTQ